MDIKILQRIHLLIVFAMIITTGITFYYFILQQPQLQTQAEHAPQMVEFNLDIPQDSMNQDGAVATQSAEKAWIGTANYPDNSYLGLRFSGTALPYQAKVESATLILTAAESTSMGINVDITAEMGDMSLPFTRSTLLSQRMKTTAVKSYDTHAAWVKDTAYLVDVTQPVSEVIEKTKNRQTITLLLQGRGGIQGKRFIYTVGNTAPKLQIWFVTQ